jgi:hypothetical protein
MIESFEIHFVALHRNSELNRTTYMCGLLHLINHDHQTSNLSEYFFWKIKQRGRFSKAADEKKGPCSGHSHVSRDDERSVLFEHRLKCTQIRASLCALWQNSKVNILSVSISLSNKSQNNNKNTQ